MCNYARKVSAQVSSSNEVAAFQGWPTAKPMILFGYGKQ